jgi:heme oxygenase
MGRFFLYPDQMNRFKAHAADARLAAAAADAIDHAADDVDALAALRAATDSRHQQLDSGLPIGAPGASLDDYARHLRMLQAWLAPLQAWLAGFDDGPRFDQTARLALIDADLAELDGRGMPAAPQDAVPAAAGPAAAAGPQPAWPRDAVPAWRWGVCYVIEGSQLGGAVLYGRLAARLAPHPLRYLKGDAPGPGPRWRTFMQGVREHVRSPDQIRQACAGACAAFDAILALAPRAAAPACSVSAEKRA